MHLEKGMTRHVLVIPTLGICLKFARMQNPFRFLREFVGISRRRGYGAAWKRLTTPLSHRGFSPAYCVFGGILANISEWRFNAGFRHPVLARTYATLGLLNIQEMVEPNPLEDHPHRRRFEKVVGWEIINAVGDLHSFSGENFGMRDGKAVAVDYASLAMQTVLAKYANKIYAELDLVSPP